MIAVTNITFQDIRFALYVLMSGWSHSGFTTHHTNKKSPDMPGFFCLNGLKSYLTSATSTPSNPCDKVRASPPCANLMRNRTSFCESA